MVEVVHLAPISCRTSNCEARQLDLDACSPRQHVEGIIPPERGRVVVPIVGADTCIQMGGGVCAQGKRQGWEGSPPDATMS